jgi:hypothetical protein
MNVAELLLIFSPLFLVKVRKPKVSSFVDGESESLWEKNVKTSFQLYKQNLNLFFPMPCRREQQTNFFNIDFICRSLCSVFLEPEPHHQHRKHLM